MKFLQKMSLWGSLLLLASFAIVLVSHGFVRAATNSSICTQTDIQKAEAGVPLLTTSQVLIAKGEPAIVANVNGQSITAQELEMNVRVVQKNHQQYASGTDIDPSLQSLVKQSVNQIRQDALNSMIDNTLMLQEGKHSGLTAPLSTVKTFMQNLLAHNDQLSQTDPARVQFEAYLCANNLTEESFLTNQIVIQGYQDSLTIGNVRSAYLRGLSEIQLQDQAMLDKTIASHIQQLRQGAKIQIFMPSSLL